MGHTKGPWKIDGTMYKKIISSSGMEIASMGSNDTDYSTDYDNARLISCAPEMLEALELVDRAYSGDGVSMAEAVDFCLLIIKKTKGE